MSPSNVSNRKTRGFGEDALGLSGVMKIDEVMEVVEIFSVRLFYMEIEDSNLTLLNKMYLLSMTGNASL